MKLAVLGCAVLRARAARLGDGAARCSTGGAPYDRTRCAIASLVGAAAERAAPAARDGARCARRRHRGAADARIDDTESVATVFASCGSDGEIMHQICDGARAQPAARSRRRVSTTPCTTRRAATGASRLPRTRRRRACARSSASFAAGLSRRRRRRWPSRAACCCVAYDLPYPAPLSSLWNVAMPFCVALVLAPATARRSIRRSRSRSPASGSRRDWPIGRALRAAHEPRRGVVAAACACSRRGEPRQVVLPYHSNGMRRGGAAAMSARPPIAQAAAAGGRDGAAGRSRLARRATDRVPRAARIAIRANPLVHEGMLPAWAGIEYAAQAMAAHFCLARRCCRRRDDRPARQACATSCAKSMRLDDIAAPLLVEAERLVARRGRLDLRVSRDGGGRSAVLVQGRATVVQHDQGSGER